MKIALINDSHLGVRNDNSTFLDSQERFFSRLFFPYCKEHNITQVLHGGDLFDRRKFINFKTLMAAEKFLFDPLIENGIEMTVIAGNHDVYYKDTNEVNSIRLIAEKYKNIEVYDKNPVIKKYGNFEIGLVPWICKQNHIECIKFIENTDVEYILGHFEIKGFEFMAGIKNYEGLKPKIFKRFKEVWSGHFHHKSERHNIKYLGTQYEMTWADSGQQKGFHVFDTETKELTYVENDDNLFIKVYYDDEKYDYTEYDLTELRNKYVKVMVNKKKNDLVFENLISNIQDVGPAHLTIIEDPDLLEQESLEIKETQDTMSILESYIDDLDIKVDKSKVKTVIRELYNEALDME